jgi:non-heme chloroperoxidase
MSVAPRYSVLFLMLLCMSALRAVASPLPAPKTGFVTANGIKLHYLDWGGSGDTILFLPGFNDTAHVYDQFAPRFTDRFHVIGLTRRGIDESGKPKDGYDASTRVEDIREFLDALHISKVTLIGHSMAGDELTLFASRYSLRVIKVVYLDAAYDRTPEGWIAGLSDPTNKPGMMQRMRMEALGMPGASDIHVDKMPPPDEWAILVATHKAVFAFRQDYTKVHAPALAFYAVTANRHYPSHWLADGADAGVRAKAEAWWQAKGHALMRTSVEQFRREIPHGEIVELNDAKHYVFCGDTADQVAVKIREFLLDNRAGMLRPNQPMQRTAPGLRQG